MRFGAAVNIFVALQLQLQYIALNAADMPSYVEQQNQQKKKAKQLNPGR
jgi:hypothetical protein